MTWDGGTAAHPLGPGTLLQLIRDADGTTRADLAALTGLARSTIAQRLDQLRAQGLLRELGESDSTGGRPPMMLAFNEDAGVTLAADLGATHSRLAVTNLGGTVLAEEGGEMAISAGPEAVLDWVDERFHVLLARGRPRRRRRPRDRHRGAGAGRARDRAAAQPADHAGLGRLPDPGALRRPLPRPGAGRQRRQHHGARRALDHLAPGRTPAVRQGRHRNRLRGRGRRPHPPRRGGRGRRHRPHPRRRRRRARAADLQLRQPRLPRGDGGRRRDGRAACATRGSRRATRAPWSSSRVRASPRRCAWSATRDG